MSGQGDFFDQWATDEDYLDARADADEDTAQAFAAYAERVSEQASIRYADALAYLNQLPAREPRTARPDGTPVSGESSHRRAA